MVPLCRLVSPYYRLSKSDSKNRSPVAQQGAGLIDAWAAVHYKTIVSPGELLLNDTANIDNTQTITIQNTGSKSIKVRCIIFSSFQASLSFERSIAYRTSLLALLQHILL